MFDPKLGTERQCQACYETKVCFTCECPECKSGTFWYCEACINGNNDMDYSDEVCEKCTRRRANNLSRQQNAIETDHSFTVGEYRSIINHPQNGEMLNLTESAKYLDVSRGKFRRIAPSPDYIQHNIYPFWSKRVLDILPVSEDFNQEEILKRGKACGSYLIGDMEEREIKDLRSAVAGAAFGGRVRNHTCGIKEITQGMSLLEQAKWAMHNCNCRVTTPEEETVHTLEEYGIKITYRSWREAQQFRNGILSAIKEHFRCSTA